MLTACIEQNQAAKREATQLHRDIQPSTSNSNYTKQVAPRPIEVVVQFCSAMNAEHIAYVAARHGVTLLKQPSPTLGVFVWKGDRGPDEILQNLQNDKDICAAEINQIYHTME